MKHFLAAAILSALATPTMALTVFKCTDSNTGAIEFTDEPCSDNQSSEQVEVQPGTVVSSEQVYDDLERLKAQKAAEAAKENAGKQKPQGDAPYANVHPAAGALNKIKVLLDTLKGVSDGE